MLLRMLRDRWMLRDVGEGGGGTAVADPPETGADDSAEVEETVTEDADDAGEGAEGEADGSADDGGDGAGEAGAAGTPRDKTVPLGSLVEIRRENAELKRQMEELRAKVGETAGAVGKLLPPEKDPVETYFDGRKPLSEGQKDALEEWVESADTPEAKEDRQLMARQMTDPGFRKALLAPLFKDQEFRKALLSPILPIIQQIYRSHDQNSWQVEQIIEALTGMADVELEKPEIGEDGKPVKPGKKLGDKLPAGLKHRERVLKEQDAAVKKAGGRWVPIRNTFTQVMEQLKAEDAKTGKVASEAAQAATERTLREVKQRRTAAGGPRSEGVPARGGTGTPGKRTPEQIDRAIQNGGSFIIA